MDDIGPAFETVADKLKSHARNKPDKTFLVELNTGRRFSYREFDGLVDRARGRLGKWGLKPGDVLSAALENGAEFCLLCFAALRSGLVFNPYPSLLNAGDIKRDTDEIRPRAVVIPEARREEFRDLGPEVIALAPGPENGFVESLASERPVFRAPNSAPAGPAFYLPSAGRLRDARTVVAAHGNMSALAPSVARGQGLDENDVHLVGLPLAHAAALYYSLLPAAWLGATVLLAGGFWNERDRFWDIVRERGVTYVQVVPTVLYILLHRPAPRRAVPSLPYIACGSAPLDRELREEFERSFALPIADLYGLTETGPTHYDAVRAPGWKRGTIGKPLDCNEVVLMDGEGRILPDGKTGEIAVRGRNVFSGYAIHPGLTAGHFRGDWFLTGDLGLRDAEGYFHFRGLKKKLIIRGGINIHPGEIDEVLETHPAVGRSSTRGEPEGFFGELIRTEVSLRPGATATKDALLAFCRNRLSPIKVPDILTIR